MTNTLTINDITTDKSVNTFRDKEEKRGRYRKARKRALDKKVVRETRDRLKDEPKACLPNGEPVRRRTYVSGQVASVTAKVKELRRSDRQTERLQCLSAKYDNGETVITGSLPVQRASVRHLAVGTV